MSKFTASLSTITLLALLGVTHISSAQSPADKTTALFLKTELESANTALSDLDTKALNCMNSFSMNLGEAQALFCDEFLRAIDGDLLASYIKHCNTLKGWRDEFILTSQNPSGALENPQDSSQDSLELMIGVEYSCGENALKERTKYVASAFNTLKGGTLFNQSTQQSIQQSLDRRLADLEQQSRLRSQGQALQNSIKQQGQRQQETTQQQMQRLTTELVRQQINNPR
jgi:hypothetical protein